MFIFDVLTSYSMENKKTSNIFILYLIQVYENIHELIQVTSNNSQIRNYF